MKQRLQYEQTMKQTLHLSTTMRGALQMLSMGRKELIHHIHETVQNNPFLEYSSHKEQIDLFDQMLSEAPSLQEELLRQLHTIQLPYHEIAADYIIHSLDEHGFFTESYEQSAKNIHVSLDTFFQTLRLIQHLEPVGVAARNSIESVIIQLQHQYLEEAADILQYHQKELAQHDYETIAQKRNLSLDEVCSYVEDIQSCSPYPCSAYHSVPNTQIEPDFTIFVEEDTYRIEPKEMGTIQLQTELKPSDPQLKTYFQNAKFFIDSLNKRNKTLLLIANEIVEIQKSYFLYQDELQACTRKEIAERTGFSTSTISRTIHDKYYEFQNHVYPLSSLMISSTVSGSSKDAICKAILMFIAEEDHEHPYQDEELVEKLAEIELYVSRRAISKYRSQLHIENSKQRKKAYAKLPS